MKVKCEKWKGNYAGAKAPFFVPVKAVRAIERKVRGVTQRKANLGFNTIVIPDTMPVA